MMKTELKSNVLNKIFHQNRMNRFLTHIIKKMNRIRQLWCTIVHQSPPIQSPPRVLSSFIVERVRGFSIWVPLFNLGPMAAEGSGDRASKKKVKKKSKKKSKKCLLTCWVDDHGPRIPDLSFPPK